MSHSSVAASVRRSKEKRPDDYCPDPRCLWALRSGPCPKHPPPAASAERAALLALVRWLGQCSNPPLLPLHLHAQVREALGDDFYVEVK